MRVRKHRARPVVAVIEQAMDASSSSDTDEELEPFLPLGPEEIHECDGFLLAKYLFDTD